MHKENSLFYCSFCGRWEEKDNKLIIGPRVSICEQCVKHCVEFLKSEKELEASALISENDGGG